MCIHIIEQISILQGFFIWRWNCGTRFFLAKFWLGIQVLAGLDIWLQLVPRPQHNYESNNGQPCRTQGKLVASHDDLINKRPQDGCLSGKLTVVWRFVSLTTRNTWVSFFINLCLPQTPATCGFLRPHQVVLEPLFSSPPIVGLLWDRSQSFDSSSTVYYYGSIYGSTKRVYRIYIFQSEDGVPVDLSTAELSFMFTDLLMGS